MIDNNYKVELGVIIRKGGANISRDHASRFIGGYTLALDLVARGVHSGSGRMNSDAGDSLDTSNRFAGVSTNFAHADSGGDRDHADGSHLKTFLSPALAKGFDTFCPVSRFVSVGEIGSWRGHDLWCKVNGEYRQRGNTSSMIFGIEDLIENISSVMRLEPGDLILTGTMAGAGPLSVGDVVEGGIDRDLGHFKFRCVRKPKVLHR